MFLYGHQAWNPLHTVLSGSSVLVGAMHVEAEAFPFGSPHDLKSPPQGLGYTVSSRMLVEAGQRKSVHASTLLDLGWSVMSAYSIPTALGSQPL